MFEQFSSGYYLGRLYIEPHDGPRAALQSGHYREVRRQLYRESTEDETPLVMRYDSQHFVVGGEEDIPERTLAVPEPWLDDYDPLEPREVFLAKADRAHQLLQFAAGDPDESDGDAHDIDGDGHSGDNGGSDSGGDSGMPPGSPFTPRSLGDVARPGWRRQ